MDEMKPTRSHIAERARRESGDNERIENNRATTNIAERARRESGDNNSCALFSTQLVETQH